MTWSAELADEIEQEFVDLADRQHGKLLDRWAGLQAFRAEAKRENGREQTKARKCDTQRRRARREYMREYMRSYRGRT